MTTGFLHGPDAVGLGRSDVASTFGLGPSDNQRDGLGVDPTKGDGQQKVDGVNGVGKRTSSRSPNRLLKGKDLGRPEYIGNATNGTVHNQGGSSSSHPNYEQQSSSFFSSSRPSQYNTTDLEQEHSHHTLQNLPHPSDLMHGHGHSLGPAPPRLVPSSAHHTHPTSSPTQTIRQQHSIHSIHLNHNERLGGAKSDAAKRGVDGQPVGDGDLGGYEGGGAGGGYEEIRNVEGNGDRAGEGQVDGTGDGRDWLVELDRLDGPTIHPADSPRINPLHHFAQPSDALAPLNPPHFSSVPSISSHAHPPTDANANSINSLGSSHIDSSGRLVPPVHIAGVYKDHVVFEPGSALELEEEREGRHGHGGRAGAFLHKVGRKLGMGAHEVEDEEEGDVGQTKGEVGSVKIAMKERREHSEETGRPIEQAGSAHSRTTATTTYPTNTSRSSPPKPKPVFTGRGPARRPTGPANGLGADNTFGRNSVASGDVPGGDSDPTVFRRADLDEQEDGVGGGDAPPSPPISDVNIDGEGAAQDADEEEVIGVAFSGEEDALVNGGDQHQREAYQQEGRHVSLTGQDFVTEPEPMLSQLDPRPASPPRPIYQPGERLSPIPASSAAFPMPPVRRPSNASTLSMASTDRTGQRNSGGPNGAVGEAVHLAPPILAGQMTRTGSLAIVRNASRQSSRNIQRNTPPDNVAAKIIPEKGASASSKVSNKAPSEIIQSRPDMFLDSPDPPIPADRADGQWTVPVSGLSLPEGAGYLQPSGSYTSAYLNPAGTSMVSSTSLASSVGAVPRPTRRSTTGASQVSPVTGRVPLPHSASSQMIPSWSGASTSAGPSGRQLTEVPGLSGQALDSDILAQADRIREERLAKRQKKRVSGDAKTFELFVPETSAGELIGPASPRSEMPPGRSMSGGLSRRLSRRQSESGGGQTDMRPMRRVSQKENPLPGHVDPEHVLVGNLIGEDHVNYVLMYNMLTGIRIGVSRCQAKIKRPLTEDDYSARHKFSFDIVGNELTPSARYDFKFKDYAPWVFRDLREDYFHLDPADYLLSLTAKYILSELGSPGKSGSFFYFSRDYRFIIKTIHHAEHKFIRSILKDYYEHIKNNPHTLISRFYGLHRVKLPRGKKIHFVIMNNLFPPHRDIHETYDLKGSAWHREYPEDMAKLNPKATLKDLNWFHRGKTFNLGPEKKALFSEQLKRDAEFLRRVGVMDYSLLIGIHNMERGNRDNIRENQLSMFSPEASDTVRRKVSSIKGASEASAFRKAIRKSGPQGLTSAAEELPKADSADRRHFLFYQDEGGLRATDEANMPLDAIYYLGVIDILTPYDLKKRLEHFWKGMTEDRHLISCQPPDEYADRFLKFLLSFMPGADISQRPKMDSGRPEKPKMD